MPFLFNPTGRMVGRVGRSQIFILFVSKLLVPISTQHWDIWSVLHVKVNLHLMFLGLTHSGDENHLVFSWPPCHIPSLLTIYLWMEMAKYIHAVTVFHNFFSVWSTASAWTDMYVQPVSVCTSRKDRMYMYNPCLPIIMDWSTGPCRIE